MELKPEDWRSSNTEKIIQFSFDYIPSSLVLKKLDQTTEMVLQKSVTRIITLREDSVVVHYLALECLGLNYDYYSYLYPTEVIDSLCK